MSMDVEINCPICLEKIDEKCSIKIPCECNTPYHIDCIVEWFKHGTSCPTCRTEIIEIDSAESNDEENEENNEANEESHDRLEEMIYADYINEAFISRNNSRVTNDNNYSQKYDKCMTIIFILFMMHMIFYTT